VTFDKKHLVPYLTNGWFALLNVFDIQQPKEINFLYYGGITPALSNSFYSNKQLSNSILINNLQSCPNEKYIPAS
jgi:hypothetical protein